MSKSRKSARTVKREAAAAAHECLQFTWDKPGYVRAGTRPDGAPVYVKLGSGCQIGWLCPVTPFNPRSYAYSPAMRPEV